MTAEERRCYIRAVIVEVYGKEPEEARVTSMDFGIIASWMDREVPLRVVLQGIEDMASKPASIRHARPAIEQEIDRWHRAVPR